MNSIELLDTVEVKSEVNLYREGSSRCPRGRVMCEWSCGAPQDLELDEGKRRKAREGSRDGCRKANVGKGSLILELREDGA